MAREINNYLVKDDKELYFVRNVYKTVNSKSGLGGQKIDPLPSYFKKIYLKYIKDLQIRSGDKLFPTLADTSNYSRLFTDELS